MTGKRIARCITGGRVTYLIDSQGRRHRNNQGHRPLFEFHKTRESCLSHGSLCSIRANLLSRLGCRTAGYEVIVAPKGLTRTPSPRASDDNDDVRCDRSPLKAWRVDLRKESWLAVPRELRERTYSPRYVCGEVAYTYRIEPHVVDRKRRSGQ
ncbi:hypothetical protein MRX96_024734 [Rhipicephalus microplus]